jgi:hypothetical protein
MPDLYDIAVELGSITKEKAAELRAAAAKGGTGAADKPKKSGTYVSTQTSARVPDDLALASKINTVFKKFYDRDAAQAELDALLPELRKQYTSKSGKSKTTVKQIFKDGQLVSTDYLTAEGVDPADWVETKIKEQVLTGNQPVNELNIPKGPAGDYFVKLKNFAGNNGIRLSDDAATAYANQIVGQAISEDTVFNVIRESAATAFPSLSEKIKNGINLKTLADPYIQSMSDILEVPASSVDLFDPHIRSALSYTMKDGAVGTKSIYDFERELRKDSRWQYTEKARKEVAGATMQVLRDFGLQG